MLNRSRAYLSSLARGRPRARFSGPRKARTWGDHRRVQSSSSIQDQQMRSSTRCRDVGYSSIYDVNTKQIAQQGNESTRKRLELHLAQIQMQDLGRINNNLDLFLHPRLQSILYGLFQTSFQSEHIAPTLLCRRTGRRGKRL